MLSTLQRATRRRVCGRRRIGDPGPARRPRPAAILAAPILAVLCVACGGSSHTTTTQPDTTTTTQTRIAAPPHRDWLGLNYNSSSGAGDITDFSRYGIVYDRLGSFDLAAGVTVRSSRELRDGLRASVQAGMVPDVVISPVRGPSGCSTNPNTSDLCLPDTAADVGDYVHAFIKTALAIQRAYPHTGVAFEPMDEPWDWAPPPGTPSGAAAAERYAVILARLLPAARAAGIPLSSIYVPATGQLIDQTSWIPDLYQAQPCLRPGPHSCGPIEAWNVHPYGPPTSTSHGIAEVPRLREQMPSGAGNIIVSEIGFCATDVLGGAHCDQNTPTVDGSTTATARWLTDVLRAARRMHDAGWLRALIIWQRTGGGWSMQLPDGKLTQQGQALVRFARSAAR